jgi:hypothetical protein
MPSVPAEQDGDATIAVAAKLLGEGDDRVRQRLLALATAGLLSLGRFVLTERLTGPAFRYAKPFNNTVNTRPASRRA